MLRNAETILSVCDPKEEIVFATSTADNEVGLIWVQREESNDVRGDKPGHQQTPERSFCQKLFS